MGLSSGITRLRRDVRYGLRQMRRSPAVDAVIILSLALGIGANTAIFSLYSAMNLRDLPVRDPAGLFVLQYLETQHNLPPGLEHWHSGRSSRDSQGRSIGLSVSWPTFTYLQAHTRTLAPLVGFVPLGMFDQPVAKVNGESMFVDGDMVTSGFFPAVGVAPFRGRIILPEDEKPDAPRVVVISARFWERAYARSEKAIGSTLTLNGVPVTVIGVAPPSFTGIEVGRSPDLWVQMGPQAGLTPWGGRPDGEPRVVYVAADWWWLEVFGRLTPGVTIDQARTEIDRLFRESLLVNINSTPPAQQMPRAELTEAGTALRPWATSGRYMTSLTILLVSGGLLLLIACANVATLLLARADARRREMSIRLVMGAPRGRLMCQLLSESALYAGMGSGVGLLFATWGGRTLLVVLSQGRDPLPIDVTLDSMVIGFAAASLVLTTLLFGLAPAAQATRLDVVIDLKEQTRTARSERGRTRFGAGKMLVVAQMALSLPLVLGAGLFLRTLSNLQHQPLGFNPERLLTFSIDPTKAGMKDARLLAAYADIQCRVRTLPCASRHCLTPITGSVNTGSASLEGDSPSNDPRKRGIHWNEVGPDFFETMGMTLVLGRSIDARDTATSQAVAVVNEALVKQFFPDQCPLGQRFWFGRPPKGAPIEIVGVVRDAKYASLRAEAPATAYMPYPQSRAPLLAMFFEVRTTGDPLAPVNGMRRAVAEIVPSIPIGSVKTQTRLIEDSLGQETAGVRLFAFFGLLALVLACIGLYGTMAYALGRRTREIGIRMALGAPRGRVLRSALAESLFIAVVGAVVGGLLAWAGTRYVNSLLFGVTPLDAPTLATTVLVVFAVAIGAGYLPARRASRLDPLKALREE